MFIALGVLLGVISLSPAILTVDGPFLPCLVPLLVSIGLILVAMDLPLSDAQRFARLVKPFVIVASIPAVWLLIQIIPLPSWQPLPSTKISLLANPIWTSLAPGFRNGAHGAISVDIGATAMALVRYLSIVGVVLLTAALTINRDRAESVLVSLTAASVLISFAVACSDLFGVNFVTDREEARDCACLGIVLSAACCSLVFERNETRRSKSGRREPEFILAVGASLAAFLICAIAIALAHSGSLIFAASCGFGAFAAVILVRRLDLGRWGAAAIGVTASVIALALVSGAAGSSQDPRLAFVKRDAASIELTQRILLDAPFLGNGGGTFSALAPIYQSSDAHSRAIPAATSAAEISIEMGRPILWGAALAAAFASISLMRASAQRGRDSFYPAAGAASLIVLLVLAFINPGLLGSAIPLVGAGILGLAIAQSQGRTSS
ncbi:hypothetical protein [Methylocapsa palsarum]|uniref:O-Antigen ligase n=1 Tax=Methylocapsa palsarum TaxID=1612308 RepID=A0A1I3XIL7_9HYPH|nr:hypothetical protein [Methylocapsa palsarum]SFK19362.1 hypothetical protein SAMN05444581_103168 [Methylocapsa palsarum]